MEAAVLPKHQEEKHPPRSVTYKVLYHLRAGSGFVTIHRVHFSVGVFRSLAYAARCIPKSMPLLASEPVSGEQTHPVDAAEPTTNLQSQLPLSKETMCYRAW